MPKSSENFETRFFNDENIKIIWSKNTLYDAQEAAIKIINAQTKAKEVSRNKAIRTIESITSLTRLYTLCSNLMLKTSGDGVI